MKSVTLYRKLVVLRLLDLDSVTMRPLEPCAFVKTLIVIMVMLPAALECKIQNTEFVFLSTLFIQ